MTRDRWDTVVQVGAVVAGLAGLRYMFKKQDVRKAEAKKTIGAMVQFRGDGESIFTVPAPYKVIVRWPSDSPWRHEAVPAQSVVLGGQTSNAFTFVLQEPLRSGLIEQVYVQAFDPDNNIVGEHKITFTGMD